MPSPEAWRNVPKWAVKHSVSYSHETPKLKILTAAFINLLPASMSKHLSANNLTFSSLIAAVLPFPPPLSPKDGVDALPGPVASVHRALDQPDRQKRKFHSAPPFFQLSNRELLKRQFSTESLRPPAPQGRVRALLEESVVVAAVLSTGLLVWPAVVPVLRLLGSSFNQSLFNMLSMVSLEALVISMLFGSFRLMRPLHSTNSEHAPVLFGVIGGFKHMRIGVWRSLALFVIATLLMEMFMPAQDEDSSLIEFIFSNPNAASFLHIAIFAPVIEEVLFRGFVFSRLLVRVGALPAYLVSSLLFAVCHYSPGAPDKPLVAGVAGAVFASIYHCSGRLWIPIALHCCNNTAAWFAWVWTGPFPVRFLGAGHDDLSLLSAVTARERHLALAMYFRELSNNIQMKIAMLLPQGSRDQRLLSNGLISTQLSAHAEQAFDDLGGSGGDRISRKAFVVWLQQWPTFRKAVHSAAKVIAASEAPVSPAEFGALEAKVSGFVHEYQTDVARAWASAVCGPEARMTSADLQEASGLGRVGRQDDVTREQFRAFVLRQAITNQRDTLQFMLGLAK